MSKGFLLKIFPCSYGLICIPTTQKILHHVKKISFVLKDIFFYTQTQKDGLFKRNPS